MDRFDGKKVIVCQVSDGISKAGELVDRVISGDVPVYHAANGAEVQESKGGRSSGSIGHQIYTQLMNGVSHMLPFVVGGGILIALAFLIDGLCVDMNALAKADRANFGTITPVAAQLKTIGGLAFGLMLPVLAGYIGEAIGDRPALAVGFVGGVIAANGKSGFLGALVAGFVSGYLILLLRKLCDKLPDALEKIAPVLIYPVAGILGIGLLMNFAIEPVMGAINTALNNGLTGMGGSSKLVLGLILGGMMAIDMGGPFNKAAYVFGTAAIAAGNYDIMAAVMIGGMTLHVQLHLQHYYLKTNLQNQKRSRTDKLYYGTRIYYRRSDSICGSRSASRTAGLHCRFCGSRSTVYGIWMYTDGTARWNLRIPCSGKCNHVSGGTGSRNCNFSGITRSTQKKII